MNGMEVSEDHDYDGLNAKMGALFADGTLIEFTSAEQIAEVVFEAATDGKDRLRYVAGNDAKKTFQQRLEQGAEAFRIGMTKLFKD